MTTGYYFLTAIIAGGLGIIGCFWLAVHFAYKNGWDDRGIHEQNRRSARVIRARSAPPTRLLEQQPWPYHGTGRHSVWAQRLTVRADTLSFAGGPATVPINARHSDSGELRALAAGTDQFIEQMRRDENAWRRQLVNR